MLPLPYGVMDIDSPDGPRHSSTIRSFNGCWTCRLRRKKCDENNPVCETCATLHITCYYNQEKPEWMDGGVKQEEMAERLKQEVKQRAHSRRGERLVHISGDGDLLKATPDKHKSVRKPCPESLTFRPQRGADCRLTRLDSRENIAFGRSDTYLLMFYLEYLRPFLFPFYRPSLLQGGTAWILEMMMDSPVVRQATLCQSSYFFSLARGTTNLNVAWNTVLTQTRNAFGVLRQSLQVIDGSDIREHLHGAVRIMTSIVQIQRFEIAISSFNNCHAHHNAALALFQQLLDSQGSDEPARPSSRFNAVISRLGTSSWLLPDNPVQMPSAEQAAFCFSSTLLIVDDIIASTMLQEQPKLYAYHCGLLSNFDGAEVIINLEATIGCQNWALLAISEIAVLDAWKQQCKRAGNLDVMELVRRATVIKDSLEAHLTRLNMDPVFIRDDSRGLLDVFTADYGQQSSSSGSQTSLVTRVWAHAALAYLFVIVSGWQPTNIDVCYHVGQIIELLTHQISPPALLRTMVWPFCVAGCLAKPAQEAHLRGMVEALQPPSVFGTVHKALEIMENVWCNRNSEDATSRDLATCFRSQGDLVLLV